MGGAHRHGVLRRLPLPQTVRAVEEHLRSGPTVYRYRWDDGLDGAEGGFHICTTWLIEAYLGMGRRAEAESLFRQYVSLLGPTGLMPEAYDPDLGMSLGNHPQAYSHLGLIRCALLLDRDAQRVDIAAGTGAGRSTRDAGPGGGRPGIP